jgi:hypothetical protein
LSKGGRVRSYRRLARRALGDDPDALDDLLDQVDAFWRCGS